MFIYLFDDANKTIMHWSIFGMEIRCLTTCGGDYTCYTYKCYYATL